MSSPLHSASVPADALGGAERASMLGDVLRGLCAARKTLPPKLFYDDAGARLFEEICALDEYYLTRTELSILRSRVGEIAALAGSKAALIEYGSGAGVKVRLLLDAFDAPAAYVPIDISGAQLARVASELRAEYPDVEIVPVCADYTRPLQLPSLPVDARPVAFFPGSTIGNFHPAEAAAFLSRVRRTVGPSGAIILGVDRRKDSRILNAAYDDAAGVTAEFNRNVLRRINRELGADFDLSAFAHRAFFNEDSGRIEMHLESMRPQTVHVAGQAIAFEAGETIWTESSYKYDERSFATLLCAAGLRATQRWTDANDWFWIAFLEPV
jgi:dimethylhistidine N-methyltransferase